MFSLILQGRATYCQYTLIHISKSHTCDWYSSSDLARHSSLSVTLCPHDMHNLCLAVIQPYLYLQLGGMFLVNCDHRRISTLETISKGISQYCSDEYLTQPRFHKRSRYFHLTWASLETISATSAFA